MKANATAMKSGSGICVYIPKAIIRTLEIKPGNLLEVEINNPFPDRIIEKKRGLNFLKKKNENLEFHSS